MSKFVKLMFGNMRFLQNPEKLTVSRGVKTESFTYLDSFTKLFVTESEPCVVRGEGVILGNGADAEFLKIYSLFEAGKPQSLLIFGCPPMRAVISSLKRLTSPGNGFIQYEIMFSEVPERRNATNLECKNFAVIGKNENLWDVSAKYKIPVEKLMELNPEIASPWRVSEEERVRLK